MNSRLFSLALVIGEEVPDRLNRFVRTHGEGVNPLIQQMCRLHIIDEARHIARARGELERQLQYAAPLACAMLRPWVKILIGQFVRTFFLPRTEVYELAGLTPGRHWHALARGNPRHQAFIAQNIRPTLDLLTRHGILPRC